MSKLLRVIDKLAILYGQQEPYVLKAAERMGSTCKSGCIGCCYQMATIMVPEGMMLARAALQRDDWLQLAEAMREASLQSQQPGMSTHEYFMRKNPCVFLDQEQKTCTVYNQRPGPCRYLYVVSPPENCFPGATDPNVGHINLMEQEAQVWKFSAETFKDGNGAVTAPLPLMTLNCMQILARDTNPERVDAINKLLEGIMNPAKWTEQVFPTMSRVTTDDEHNALGEALQKVGLNIVP